MGKKSLVIIGAVGNCFDIADAARASGFEVAGFLDDNKQIHGREVYGAMALGPISMAKQIDDVSFICGIGGSGSYKEKLNIISAMGIDEKRFATVIHPSSSISPSAKIGPGTAILANVSVGANVTVGSHVMVLPQTVFGHDSRIGDGSIFAASVTVSGNVSIGTSCYMGAGASIRDGVIIGDGALLGMGAVLLNDMPANTTYIGNPAKPIGK